MWGNRKRGNKYSKENLYFSRVEYASVIYIYNREIYKEIEDRKEGSKICGGTKQREKTHRFQGPEWSAIGRRTMSRSDPLAEFSQHSEIAPKGTLNQSRGKPREMGSSPDQDLVYAFFFIGSRDLKKREQRVGVQELSGILRISSTKLALLTGTPFFQQGCGWMCPSQSCFYPLLGPPHPPPQLILSRQSRSPDFLEKI